MEAKQESFSGETAWPQSTRAFSGLLIGPLDGLHFRSPHPLPPEKQTPDDVYDGAFNRVEVDLGLSNVAVSSNQFWSGDPITVSWNGANRTGAQLLGDWTDAVYLSADDKWDINDILLANVPHSDGLTTNEIYSASEIVCVPGLLPGDYYLLVRADVHNEEGSGKPDNLVAFGPIPLSVRAFPSGDGAFSGVLTPEARYLYYAVNVPAGQSLLVNLPDPRSQ